MTEPKRKLTTDLHPNHPDAKIYHTSRQDWFPKKKPFLAWIDTLQIKDRHKNILKTMVYLSNEKGITVASNETILNNYNKHNPKEQISKRTLYTYLDQLETQKIIKRGEQKKWNSPCAIKLLTTKSVMRSVQLLHTNTLSPDREVIASRNNSLISLPRKEKSALAPDSAARENINEELLSLGLEAREQSQWGLPLIGRQAKALAYLEDLERRGVNYANRD